MSHEEHHHETPKKVYFGIPFAFAFVFWFIVFLSLKACDGPKDCCKEEGGECCKAKKECCEKGAKEKKECCEKGDKKGEVKEEMKNEEAAPAETTEPTAEPAKSEEAPAKHE